jgi:type VI secretion system protein VasD
MLDQALQTVGLQRPSVQLPDAATNAAGATANKSSKVVIRLHAGQVLNTDPSGNSLPVVARIYKLKDKDAFLQAPDTAFVDMKASKSSDFSSDIEDAKEVVLTPGQRYEVTETVPSDAVYIGVVALFRAPAERRWRFVFETKAAAKTGLTLGVHGCALSVATGQAVGVDAELTRLAGVECS